MSTLHQVVKDSEIEEASKLLAAGADVNEIDNFKRTPLILARFVLILGIVYHLYFSFHIK